MGEESSKKTLVIDLDETLVFSSLEAHDVVHHELEIAGQDVFVQVRPHALEFCEHVRKRWTCRIWSTGQPVYVEAVCERLGIDWMTIWGRDKCRRLDEIPENHHEPYDKPLHHIREDLENIVILDNAPGVFHCNPDNGIPITTWRGDYDDRQLELVCQYLDWLVEQPDVRRYHWHWARDMLLVRNAAGGAFR